MLGPLLLALMSCSTTVGRPLEGDRVDEVRIGYTDRSAIRELFGRPWQVGLEDGRISWRYVCIRHGPFRDVEASELVVLFDELGIVSSYRFHTTVGEEHDR